MAAARPELPQTVIYEVLRQVHQTYPAAKRAELADSVVEYAIRETGPGSDGLQAIGFSGSADPTLGGTPDPEALDRLLRIHREARDSMARSDVLYLFVEQVNPARAIPLLRDIATSPSDGSGWYAVIELERLAFKGNRGSQGDRAAAADVLRELWQSRATKQSRVKVELEELGRMKNWRP
jgi:hypothetical protein